MDPDRIARGLSIADQQLVEIAKALSQDVRVIIMDEPTAALTLTEVDRLFGVVETLRAHGAAVLFVSHRLDEVFRLCQTITVMRDGRHVLTRPTSEMTPQSVIRSMVGRDMDSLFPKVDAELGTVVLKVERLTREGVFTDVSFEVRSGEIVAFAGLVGAGRSEVARAIFGIDKWDAGRVLVNGRKLRRGSPAGAMAAGVALVPEDRRLQGLVMDLAIDRNVALASLHRIRRFGVIPRGGERRFASDWVTRLQLKYGRLWNPVSTLSGGNQQKVVLAKWLARRPAVLIVDEPTRGIDVGTKAEVHRLLSTLAAEGVAVLMISSELPEVLGMADRTIVLFEGRVAGRFDRADADEHVIMRAATGFGEAA
jgi:rhamnose transport system ATP-binding protein